MENERKGERGEREVSMRDRDRGGESERERELGGEIERVGSRERQEVIVRGRGGERESR